MVRWIKGHATEDDITAGLSSPLDREYNDRADALANKGREMHNTNLPYIKQLEDNTLQTISIQTHLLQVAQLRNYQEELIQPAPSTGHGHHTTHPPAHHDPFPHIPLTQFRPSNTRTITFIKPISVLPERWPWHQELFTAIMDYFHGIGYCTGPNTTSTSWISITLDLILHTKTLPLPSYLNKSRAPGHHKKGYDILTMSRVLREAITRFQALTTTDILPKVTFTKPTRDLAKFGLPTTSGIACQMILRDYPKVRKILVNRSTVYNNKLGTIPAFAWNPFLCPTTNRLEIE